ncbi:21328_t:CDS:2, partial [Racocetra persica]
MNNNPGIFNNTGDQTSYLGIPENESLFLPAERPIRPKPIVNMPILRKKLTGTKTTDLIDLEEGESTKDLDIEMKEVYKDHEVKKVEPPKVNKKKEDVKVGQKKNIQKRLGSEWDEIMIEERDIRQMNEEIILYDEGPVAGFILAQEEDNRSISDLFNYYYEKGSCSNIKYNIKEVEDNQRKQLLELLRENPNLCAQDISELGRTDIIRHCIPTQD